MSTREHQGTEAGEVHDRPHPAPRRARSFRVRSAPLRETGEWIPIDPDARPCDNAIDAIRMCFQHIVPQWKHVLHRVNVLRGLCKHPNFGLEEDGIDADTMHQEALSLASAVTNTNYDFAYLLQDPNPDEIVRIGDKVLQGTELVDLAEPEPTE